jgi:acetyl esterase/lipase
MASLLPRAPYDPELSAMLTAKPAMPLDVPSTLTHDEVIRIRPGLMRNSNLSALLSTRPVTHEERQVPSPAGSKSVTLSIFSPEEAGSGLKPCIYWLHGGGLIFGDQLFGISFPLNVVEKCNVICVSADYGLAPENTYPGPVEDCYAALKWTSEHAEELGIDPRRIMIAGTSAGAGLAAGTALLCRDRKGPQLFAMCLKSPMLDDRDLTLSKRQYAENGTWSQHQNSFGWDSYLGKDSRGPEVSIYAAAGRAEDLSGLPQTFIDAGSAEIFRDDAIAFASKLWASGVQAELHIWPGVFHGSEGVAPAAMLTRVAIDTRMAWIERTFARGTSIAA